MTSPLSYRDGVAGRGFTQGSSALVLFSFPWYASTTLSRKSLCTNIRDRVLQSAGLVCLLVLHPTVDIEPISNWLCSMLVTHYICRTNRIPPKKEPPLRNIRKRFPFLRAYPHSHPSPSILGTGLSKLQAFFVVFFFMVCVIYTRASWTPASPTNIEFSLQNIDNLVPIAREGAVQGGKLRSTLWGSRGQGRKRAWRRHLHWEGRGKGKGYRRAARGWELRVWGHQSGASEVSVYEGKGFTSVFGRAWSHHRWW